MKTISDGLRAKIDTLRKTKLNEAEPTWEVDIFRDQEKMLNSIQGARITSGTPHDIQPAIAQGNLGRYHVAFGRNGEINYMISSTTNIPAVTWSSPSVLFPGEDPDLDFDGFFDNVGTFTPVELLMVYENPTGTLKFRRRNYTTEAWGSAVTVNTNGTNPSICRGWADPPDIGGEDQGIFVFFTRDGQIRYTYSDNDGVTWADSIAVDYPPGGTKTNVQVFRLADYTLGIIYEYDNGITSEVWFLKTTRRYVNIASPDETLQVDLGGYRQLVWETLELDHEETVSPGAGDYNQGEFGVLTGDTEETINVEAGEFRQVTFSGVNP